MRWPDGFTREEFIDAWRTPGPLQSVANRLGITGRHASSLACGLRRDGVELQLRNRRDVADPSLDGQIERARARVSRLEARRARLLMERTPMHVLRDEAQRVLEGKG